MPNKDKPDDLEKEHKTKIPKNTTIKFRADTSEKSRTSFLLSASAIETPKKENINDALQERSKRITTHRRIVEITKASERGSPQTALVHSPTSDQKHEVWVSHTMGESPFKIYYFTDNRNTIYDGNLKFETLSPDNPLFTSDVYKIILKPTEKYQEITITLKLLQETKKANRGKKRSQGEVMAIEKSKARKASATTYAQASEQFPEGTKFDFSHLIAYFVLGQLAQHDQNLVITPATVNTSSIFIENLFPYLAEEYLEEGFKLAVEAEVVPETQIGTRMKYTIVTPDFPFKLDVDAQNTYRPHIVQGDYLEMIVQEIIREMKKEKTARVDPSSEVAEDKGDLSSKKRKFEKDEKGERALSDEEVFTPEKSDKKRKYFTSNSFFIRKNLFGNQNQEEVSNREDVEKSQEDKPDRKLK